MRSSRSCCTARTFPGHFLDVDDELRHLLSRSLCTGHLAGKSGPELGRLLGVVSDFPTEVERQAATEEPIYTHDAQHDATAPRAADAPTPPVCWLSTQLVNEDALEDALAGADVLTLRALKGVSLAWRARARRVLCVRAAVRTHRPAPHEQPRRGDQARPLGQPRRRSPLRRRGRRVARAAQPGKGDGAGRLRGGRGRVEALGVFAIALPASLTSIGEDAFYACSSLSSIELPASLTSIGEFAFHGCSSLTSIELPASLTSISGCAFNGCSER